MLHYFHVPLFNVALFDNALVAVALVPVTLVAAVQFNVAVFLYRIIWCWTIIMLHNLILHYYNDSLVAVAIFNVALFDFLHFDVALFNIALFTVALFNVALLLIYQYWINHYIVCKTKPLYCVLISFNM